MEGRTLGSHSRACKVKAGLSFSQPPTGRRECPVVNLSRRARSSCREWVSGWVGEWVGGWVRNMSHETIRTYERLNESLMRKREGKWVGGWVDRRTLERRSTTAQNQARTWRPWGV